MIDTSVDTAHPALKDRVTVRRITSDDRPAVASWHGTSVTALLAGLPESSTPGLIPNAKFYVADVFFADELGRPATDSLSLLKALHWMEQMQVDIVNLSVSGPPDETVKEAIARLSAKGVLFVAAAGNEGPNAPWSYPAAYPQVIAVTAVNKQLRGYPYANHGDYIDMAAPGVRIWTALPNGKQGFVSGTSFAAPYVTAVVAAVVRDVPKRTTGEILKVIATQDLGVKGPDPIYGRGLVLAPRFCGQPTWPEAVVVRATPADVDPRAR